MSAADFLLILQGLPITLALTGAAFLIGAVLGFPCMLARQSKILAARVVMIALIAVIRSIPPIVWLFLIFFGVGAELIQLSPIATAIAVFGVIATVNMAEIYRGGMIAIHRGQWEAATALNLGRLHTYKDIIFPQMFRVSLPSSATYVIGLLKNTSIASTIGVAEITFRGSMISQMNFTGLKVFAVVGVIYIVISVPIAWISRVVDHRLRAKVSR